MNKKALTITYIPTKDLYPALYNPRIHDKEMLKRLESSIKEFGLVDPIIVNNHKDRKNIVIGGHARLKIAKKLKHTKIPAVYVTLSEKKEKELNVKLNKISGEFDFAKLTELFDQEFLLETGFLEEELNSYWDSVADAQDDEFDLEKDLKNIKEPVTQKGDLIIMGDHKLLCASSTDKKAVDMLFGEDKASLYYSDPPFNINLNYDTGVGNKKKYGGNVDDNKSSEGYKEFIRQVLTNALGVSEENLHAFMWCDEAWVWVFQTLYMGLGIKNRRLNLWLKNNASPTPNVAFNKVTEFCVYGTIGSPYLNTDMKNLNEVLNKGVGTGNELFDNVWAIKRLPGNTYEHPTQKPPELHEKAILRCTKPGDIIFDSFSGSGSTMICAEQLNRKVYSLEISEIFCDVAMRRWERMTGKKAEIIKGFYETT